MTRTQIILALIFLTALACFGQTTVYLPNPNAAIGTITVTNCTNANPIVVTAPAHGLSNGAAVWIDGIAGNTNCDGFFQISNVSTNNFTLANHLYYSTVPAGNGAFASAGNPGPYATPLLPYTLIAHPRVFLDGPTGALTVSVSNTSTKASSSNRFYTQLQNIYTNGGFNTNYTTPGIDCSSYTGTGMSIYADMGLLWFAGGQTNSSYLTIAKYGIDNIQQAICSDSVSGAGYYSYSCSPAVSMQCGRGDFMLYSSEQSSATAYSYDMVYSQLSSSEKSNFNDKMWNDNALFRNSNSPSLGGGSGGIAGDPTTSCTPWPASTLWNQSAHYCGFWWYIKHEYEPVFETPGQEANFPTDYDPSNLYSSGLSFPYASNHGMAHLKSIIAMALATADDDPRARSSLTQAIVWMLKWRYTWNTSSWTGMTENGSRYQQYISSPDYPELLLVLNNAIPGYGMVDTASHTLIPQEIWGLLPDGGVSAGLTDGFALDQWIDSTGINGANTISQWGLPVLELTQLYPSDSFVPYEYWLLKNWQSSTFNTYNWETFQQELINQYIIYDPTISTSNVTGLPAQYLFKDTGLSDCQTLWGSRVAIFPWGGSGNPATSTPGCYVNMSFQHAISKSDWTSTATQLWMSASWGSTQLDRAGGGQYGAYHIYRNGYLLGGNSSATNPAQPTGSAHNVNAAIGEGSGLASDMVIEIGGIDNWNSMSSTANVSANFARWAGNDPTGDSLSRYTYAMVDVSPTYLSSADVARANRHIIHFKKPSTQDYVVSYDDVALSAGNEIQAWWYYYYQGLSGTNTISVNTSARTISNTLNGTSGKLLTSFLPVAGSNSLAYLSNGEDATTTTWDTYTCPSTNGSTCNNSATSYEAVAVHQPCNGTSCTMPTLTQPTCSATGGNCAAVQIAESTGPKVAVFARQGALLIGVSFTSTHSGTAQYLVAGLDASHTYNVTVGGSPVLTGATVNANDNTLYFESTDGAVVVSASGVTTYTLTVSTTTGTGTGTINITNNCQTGSFTSGTTIGPCTATPNGGSVFAGWTGTLGCTGTGTCTASLTGNSTVNAVFNLAPTSAPATMQGIGSIQGTAVIQ
jgi:hypothetical protein